MAKFHVGRGGKAAVCSAKKGKCPYGSDDEHYKTREEAQKVAEQKMTQQNNTLKSTKSKKKKTVKNNLTSKKEAPKIDKITSQNFQSSFAAAIEIGGQYLKDSGLDHTINTMAASLAYGDMHKANNYMSMLKSHIRDFSYDDDMTMYYMPDKEKILGYTESKNLPFDEEIASKAIEKLQDKIYVFKKSIEDIEDEKAKNLANTLLGEYSMKYLKGYISFHADDSSPYKNKYTLPYQYEDDYYYRAINNIRYNKPTGIDEIDYKLGTRNYEY